MPSVRDRLGAEDMRISIVTALLLATVVSLVGCESPGRADYLAAAEQHARYARIASEGVQANEETAQSFEAQGNQAAARQAEKTADQFRSAYQTEQFQANKDRWLGEWWPSY